MDISNKRMNECERETWDLCLFVCLCMRERVWIELCAVSVVKPKWWGFVCACGFSGLNHTHIPIFNIPTVNLLASTENEQFHFFLSTKSCFLNHSQVVKEIFRAFLHFLASITDFIFLSFFFFFIGRHEGWHNKQCNR